MTQEEIQAANQATQQAAWVRNKKYDSRYTALSTASGLVIKDSAGNDSRMDGENILKEADKIYEWLVKDLEQ